MQLPDKNFFQEMESRENFQKSFNQIHEKINGKDKMKKESKEIVSSAGAMLAQIAQIQPEIVKVTTPNNLVFEMETPDDLGKLLAGELPESLSAEVLESWKAQGVTVYSSPKVLEDSDEVKPNAELALAKKMYDATGQLLKLSRNPKIVTTETSVERNEVSLTDIPKKDLNFLLKWVMAGGSAISMMAMFPEK